MEGSTTRMTTHLFQPIRLRELELVNRVTVSPMCQYSAGEDGAATDWHVVHLGQLAQSGAGLLIFEATAVEARGRISAHDLGLYNDADETALMPVMENCRRHGGAKLGLQLGHAGRKGSAQVPWEGGKALAPAAGAWETIAPSAEPYDAGWHRPKAASEADLEEIRAAYVATVERAERLGFDLIELHMAHGYLLGQFLSPLANKRGDRWGGSFENRVRFPLSVFEAVRRAWPKHKPLGVRLQGTDWAEGGWTPEEAVAIARLLEERGCDYIVVSSGGLVPRAKITIGPGFQVPFAAAVKRGTSLPVMAVGQITDGPQAEAIIAAGDADMVAVARGFLADPRWPWRAALALGEPVPFCPPQYARALGTAGFTR